MTAPDLPRVMPSPNPFRDAALKWARGAVGVVPLRLQIVPDKKGKLSPIPWIRWKQDGTPESEIGTS